MNINSLQPKPQVAPFPPTHEHCDGRKAMGPQVPSPLTRLCLRSAIALACFLSVILNAKAQEQPPQTTPPNNARANPSLPAKTGDGSANRSADITDDDKNSNANERNTSPRTAPRLGGAARGNALPRGDQAGNLRRTPIEITPERREQLIAFVREYNPPIERLMKNLESKNPTQFRAALQAMAREVQMLEELKTRDPERFEISLELWRNRSRLDLLAAQIALQADNRRPDLRRQMQQVMQEQNELRAKLVELELSRLADRQTRLEKNREQLRNITESDVRRQVNDLINRNRRNVERSQKKSDGENKDGG